MFSVAEKQKIAEAVEKVLLEINHPEMPSEKPDFELHVNGKESWSYADIKPNWFWNDQGSPVNPNPWNEKARDIIEGVGDISPEQKKNLEYNLEEFGLDS